MLGAEAIRIVTDAAGMPCHLGVVREQVTKLGDDPARLRAGFIARKRITVHSAAERVDLDLPGIAVVERAPHRTQLDVDLGRVSVEQVVQALLARTTLEDLSIEDPPMDEIVRAIYARGASSEPTTADSIEEALPCTA